MGEWPHPPAVPEERSIIPQAAFLARAGGLGLLAASAVACSWGALKASAWLAPVALGLVVVAGLAAWGASVQFLGGEKVDDHPWV